MKNYRHLFTSIILFAALVSLTSCKPKQEFSESKYFAEDCSCSDLECWDRVSNKAVSGSLQCAKTAGIAAVTGMAANIISFGMGVNDIYEAFDSGSELYQIFLVAIGETVDTAAMKNPDKIMSNKIACLRNFSTEIKSFIDLFTGLSGLRGQPASALVISVVKSSFNALQRAIAFGQNASQCFPANGQASSDLQLRKLQKGLGKIMKAIAILVTLKDCGFAFGEAGEVAFGNTKCLMEDVDKMFQQWEQLAGAHEANTRRGEYSNENSQYCNDQPPNCSTFAAGDKWGGYLYNYGDDSMWEWRSTFCARACTYTKDRVNECNRVAPQLFGNNSPGCTQACNEKWCQAAVERCVSYCCYQKGSCVEDAWETIRSGDY